MVSDRDMLRVWQARIEQIRLLIKYGQATEQDMRMLAYLEDRVARLNSQLVVLV